MMYWNTEAEFVEAFLSSVHLLLNPKTSFVQVWREIRTGYGRPDIAIVEYDPEVYNYRQFEEGIMPLSTKAAYAINYLITRRWVKMQTLSDFLNCRNSEFKSTLEELVQRELIIIKEHLVKARPKSEILAVKRLVVFEAKLHQWREAADQAERHLWFTNESYVLMPPKSKRSSRLASFECTKRGIGLGLFDIDLGLETVVQPAQTGYINSPFLWIVNERLWEENNGRQFVDAGISRAQISISFFND